MSEVRFDAPVSDWLPEAGDLLSLVEPFDCGVSGIDAAFQCGVH